MKAPEGRPYVEALAPPIEIAPDSRGAGGRGGAAMPPPIGIAGGIPGAAGGGWGAGAAGVARVTGCAIGGVGALPKCVGAAAGVAAREGVGVAPTFPAPLAAGVNSSAVPPSRATVMTPPHTAQRARTLAPGILPGSTRKTDRHSGQLTFMLPGLHGRRHRNPTPTARPPQARDRG
jgi:hypothetical protein